MILYYSFLFFFFYYYNLLNFTNDEQQANESKNKAKISKNNLQDKPHCAILPLCFRLNRLFSIGYSQKRPKNRTKSNQKGIKIGPKSTQKASEQQRLSLSYLIKRKEETMEKGLRDELIHELKRSFSGKTIEFLNERLQEITSEQRCLEAFQEALEIESMTIKQELERHSVREFLNPPRRELDARDRDSLDIAKFPKL